jgi:transposase
VVDRHPTGTISSAWDHADTHRDDAVEAIVRAAAGRLVLLDWPTYSPWLNPIEMLWRQIRREVTHGELFASLDALLKAAHAFFDRYNQYTARVFSIIGAHAAYLAWVYLKCSSSKNCQVPERTTTDEIWCSHPPSYSLVPKRWM